MAWIFLTVAVLSNIVSNMMFKLAMGAFPQERTFETLFKFALNPYLWLGGLACVLLLGCYLLALRDLGLKEADLDRAAEIATRNPYWNPRPVERDALRRLLAAAWAGEAPGR